MEEKGCDSQGEKGCDSLESDNNVVKLHYRVGSYCRARRSPFPLESHYASSYLQAMPRPKKDHLALDDGSDEKNKLWGLPAELEETDIFNSLSTLNNFILVFRDDEGSSSHCVMPFRLDTRRKSVVSNMMSGGPGVYTICYQMRNLRAYREAPVRCGISIVTPCSEEFASFAIIGHNETKRQGIYKAELQIDGAGYARPNTCRRFDIGRDDRLEFDLQIVIHDGDDLGVCNCDISVIHDKQVLAKHSFKKSTRAQWYAFCHATENHYPRSDQGFIQGHLSAKVEGHMVFKESEVKA